MISYEKGNINLTNTGENYFLFLVIDRLPPPPPKSSIPNPL